MTYKAKKATDKIGLFLRLVFIQIEGVTRKIFLSNPEAIYLMIMGVQIRFAHLTHK